jgi:hypothetical protein
MPTEAAIASDHPATDRLIPTSTIGSQQKQPPLPGVPSTRHTQCRRQHRQAAASVSTQAAQQAQEQEQPRRGHSSDAIVTATIAAFSSHFHT